LVRTTIARGMPRRRRNGRRISRPSSCLPSMKSLVAGPTLRRPTLMTAASSTASTSRSRLLPFIERNGREIMVTTIPELMKQIDSKTNEDFESRPFFAQRNSIKKLLLPLFLQVGTTAESLRADSAGFWHVGEERYWLPRLVFRGANET